MRSRIMLYFIPVLLASLTVSAVIFLKPTAYPSPLGYAEAEKVEREQDRYRSQQRPPPITSDRIKWKPGAQRPTSKTVESKDDRYKEETDRRGLIEQIRASDAAQQSVVISRDQTRISLTSLIIGLWTLGAAGLAALYAKDAANAAIRTLEADLLATRPVVQLANFSIAPELSDDFGSGVRVRASLKNFGQAGCWIEEMSLWLTANERLHDPDYVAGGEFQGFIGPGESQPLFPDSYNFTFTPVEEDAIMTSFVVFVGGSAVYRDAGNRRWKTHFAYSVDLDHTFVGSQMIPVSKEGHWIDKRLADMPQSPN